MTRYTVKLSDDTVGTIDGDDLMSPLTDECIGDQVRIELHDENGNTVEKDGFLAEILVTENL